MRITRDLHFLTILRIVFDILLRTLQHNLSAQFSRVKVAKNCFTLAYETDRFSWNVGNQSTMRKSPKERRSLYIAAQAWKHANVKHFLKILSSGTIYEPQNGR